MDMLRARHGEGRQCRLHAQGVEQVFASREALLPALGREQQFDAMARQHVLLDQRKAVQRSEPTRHPVVAFTLVDGGNRLLRNVFAQRR
jgi:hypothetical protein